MSSQNLSRPYDRRTNSSYLQSHELQLVSQVGDYEARTSNKEPSGLDGCCIGQQTSAVRTPRSCGSRGLTIKPTPMVGAAGAGRRRVLFVLSAVRAHAIRERTMMRTQW